jgi:hypothetical protein
VTSRNKYKGVTLWQTNAKIAGFMTGKIARCTMDQEHLVLHALAGVVIPIQPLSSVRSAGFMTGKNVLFIMGQEHLVLPAVNGRLSDKIIS